MDDDEPELSRSAFYYSEYVPSTLKQTTFYIDNSSNVPASTYSINIPGR